MAISRWLALCAALISGCATPYWTTAYDHAPAKSYKWHVVSPYVLGIVCQNGHAEACAAYDAKREHCDIFSWMTESQAAAPDTWMRLKEDVRKHELKHCEGWNHA